MNTFYATVFHSVRKCHFLCLMAVCCASVQSWAVVRYVKLTPTGTANGSSWANASGNLQSIINASIAGDEVWVAQGTYYPSADFFGNPSPADVRTKTFVMKQGVAIYSGFLGNETLRTQRNWMTNLTTLSGEIQQDNNASNNCYHVILNSGNGLNSTAVLDGFTITGGNANGTPNFNRQGGGMYNDGGDSPSVINCIFSGNSASGSGAGMYNLQASPTVTNCTFSSNSATSGGGGMYNDEGEPTVTRCVFLNNAATGGKGGGMWNNKASSSVSNCTFSGNSSNTGGGMYTFFGTFTVTNCTFINNSATEHGGGLYNEITFSQPSVRNCTFSGNSATNGGGGIYNTESSPSIINCTLNGNSATNNGGGIHNLDSSPTVTNTVLWGNGSEIVNANNFETSNPNVTYSIIQGGYTGTGNLNVNPLFVNAADIDGADNIFRTADDGLNLNPCSPAINAGTNAGVTTDILGNARVSTTDVGAYEYQDSTAPTITASGPTSFCNGGSVTLNSNVGNNNALNFVKTSSQYVSVPHSASINLGATFTMEAWVKYSGANATIIDKGNYNFLWSLNANSNGNKMGFYTRNTGAWVYSTGIVPENTWTHVAITLSAGTLTFYINGVASGTASVTFSQDVMEMNIGRQQPTFCACNHFNGSMDELRLWNVIRTPVQMLTNMNSTIPTNSAGLVAYYKFDEGTGTSTADATSNGNNATLVNAPTWQVPATSPVNRVVWSPGGATTPTIVATNVGTYTATVTSGYGCTFSGSITINSVSPVPTSKGNTSIPTGGSVSLTATGCSGSSGIYTLKWYKASDNSLVTMPISPSTTTNYYAKCENIFNATTCLSPASANVIVYVGNIINSLITGDWENTNTWTPSRIPLPTDNVIINNHIVTVTTNAANAKSVDLKSGANLRYLNGVTKLKVGF